MNGKVTSHADEIKRMVAGRRGRALFLGAGHILTMANRTVPIEEATLERSGGIDVDASRGVATIYYDTPYARRQHEDLSLKHDEGRRAKWLELAMKEEAERVFAFIGGELRQAVLR